MSRSFKVWVVTKASPESTLQDIMFSCSATEMILQVRGGLEAHAGLTGDDEPLFFQTKEEAEEEALRRLAAVKPVDATAVAGAVLEALMSAMDAGVFDHATSAFAGVDPSMIEALSYADAEIMTRDAGFVIKIGRGGKVSEFQVTVVQSR